MIEHIKNNIERRCTLPSSSDRWISTDGGVSWRAIGLVNDDILLRRTLGGEQIIVLDLDANVYFIGAGVPIKVCVPKEIIRQINKYCEIQNKIA
jgi:hypothetical protein